jgi:hypothetical protein
MQISILLESSSFESIKELVNQHFGQEMRFHQLKLSMFEQYDVRPVAHAHIPGIWKYRVVVKGGKYYFGTL